MANSKKTYISTVEHRLLDSVWCVITKRLKNLQFSCIIQDKTVIFENIRFFENN